MNGKDICDLLLDSMIGTIQLEVVISVFSLRPIFGKIS